MMKKWRRRLQRFLGSSSDLSELSKSSNNGVHLISASNVHSRLPPTHLHHPSQYSSHTDLNRNPSKDMHFNELNRTHGDYMNGVGYHPNGNMAKSVPNGLHSKQRMHLRLVLIIKHNKQSTSLAQTLCHITQMLLNLPTEITNSTTFLNNIIINITTEIVTHLVLRQGQVLYTRCTIQTCRFAFKALLLSLQRIFRFPKSRRYHQISLIINTRTTRNRQFKCVIREIRRLLALIVGILHAFSAIKITVSLSLL